MEGSVYTNLGLKLNKTFREKRDEEIFTLKDFLDHKFAISSKEEFKKVISRELKTVLEKENIFVLITAFFELETNLQQAQDLLDLDSDFSFDEFYKNVSPLLMRSILENKESPANAQKILQSLKESLRIALEEELYDLKEQF